MKDRRVAYFRGALGELLESLDATLRIARWRDEESVPAPLRPRAALLPERLGKANRLAADRFVGSPIAARAVSELAGAIQRLDLAFVAYRNAPERDDMASALDTEIAKVRSSVELELSA
jgi:hypothetical protein